MSKKITIIGMGNSGKETAVHLAIEGIIRNEDTLVLVDVNERAKGCKGEIVSACEIRGKFPHIVTINAREQSELAKIKGSDIVIVTVSAPFPKGGFSTRGWSLFKNAEPIRFFAQQVKKYCQNAKIIMDSNPLDVMSSLFAVESGINPLQIFGKGGDLDTQRLVSMLSHKIARKVEDDTESRNFRNIQHFIFNNLLNSGICVIGNHEVGEMVSIVPQKLNVLNQELLNGWLTHDELKQVIYEAEQVGPKSSKMLENRSP
ncbi:MAG: hypothetical protein SFT90_04440, partial [Rickettsiales bacterium]|nr:hypothetical protein [Rickettsiales bacterium]